MSTTTRISSPVAQQEVVAELEDARDAVSRLAEVPGTPDGFLPAADVMGLLRDRLDDVTAGGVRAHMSR